MALDFPSSPTTGQIFSDAGSTWTWDGTKWVGASGAVGITGTPANGQWAQWSGADTITGVSTAAMPFVETAGDTMTGDLTIAKITPALNLNATGTNDPAVLNLQNNNSIRWSMQMSTTAESAGNVGSDFILNRCDNTGSTIDTTLTVTRANGQITLSQPLNLPGNPSSALQAAPKQYADLKLPLTGGTLTGPLGAQVLGVNTAAAAGIIGELLTASAGPIALPNAWTSVVNLSVPPGDWDIWGTYSANAGGVTANGFNNCCISMTANSAATVGGYNASFAGPAGECYLNTPHVPQRITGTTIYYVNAYAGAAASAVSATIYARRRH